MVEVIVTAESVLLTEYQARPSRVLFLAHDLPWPTLTGGRRRDAQLLPQAVNAAKIDLVIIARGIEVEKDPSEAARGVPTIPGLTSHIFADESDPGPAPARTSKGARELLRQLAIQRDFDAVHVEGHYLLHLVPPDLWRCTVLVEHNIESQLLQQRRQLGEPISAEDVAGLAAREELAWRRAGAVVVLTPEDADEIRRRVPTARPHLIPNGWDHIPKRMPPPDDRMDQSSPHLLFLANYDYLPNRDALDWLLSEIFPSIRQRMPGARLRVAGANLRPDLARAANGVRGVMVAGEVPDVCGEFDRADIVLCPLRVGGGIKVKIIEAIRRSCLLVSTSVGVQGVPEPLKSAICVADEVEAFSHHVTRLCAKPEERRQRRAHMAEGQHALPTWRQSASLTTQLWKRVLDAESPASFA